MFRGAYRKESISHKKNEKKFLEELIFEECLERPAGLTCVEEGGSELHAGEVRSCDGLNVEDLGGWAD